MRNKGLGGEKTVGEVSVQMTVDACAKINWTLHVLGMRPDGYHDLRSIVLPVPSLRDTVTLEAARGISCQMEGLDVPEERNLAFRAACALREATGCAGGVRLSIVKRIPAGAGLGGGSADAAAVLNGLNRLWRLGLTEGELMQIGARVGSDVPALVLGGPVLMEGRGERVRRLLPADDADGDPLPAPDALEVFTPPISASTAAVYREFRMADRGHFRNDLQPAAIRLYPGIAEAIRNLERKGLRRVTMSGSGSTVYGVR